MGSYSRGRTLHALLQDPCIFYIDHVLDANFARVMLATEESCAFSKAP